MEYALTKRHSVMHSYRHSSIYNDIKTLSSTQLFSLPFFRRRYENELQGARSVGIKKGVISGVGMGVTMFIMFGSYGLAFWYVLKGHHTLPTSGHVTY